MNDLESLSLPIEYEVDSSFMSAKFIKMRLKICHDGKNPKGTFFSLDGMDAAKPSLLNSPVLAHVVFDADGKPKFGGHDMHVEDDAENDEAEVLVYDEQPIGVIPESCHYETVEEDNRHYVYADCYIWRGYSGYAERIIERDSTIKLSMEVNVNRGTYDSKSKTYYVHDYFYKGITFLGDDRTPGMAGACGSVINFSRDTFLAELKEEIKNLSKEEETLDEKIPAVEQAVETPTEEQQFELDTNEHELLADAVCNCATWQPEWADHEVPLYWLLDYDAEAGEVYVRDNKEWKLYGAHYTKNGDVYTIDVTTMRRMKYAVVELNAGEEPVDPPIPDIYTDTIKRLSDEKSEYEAAHSHSNEEYEALAQYKADREDGDKRQAYDAVIAEFEDIADTAEFVELKPHIYEAESEDALRNTCYAIRGKNMKFSLPAKKPAVVRVPINVATDDKPYGGIIDTYNH